jgi:hypothetical protein
MWRIRRFFRRVYNVWRWLPIIWKDQDWDDSYIVKILVKKLEHQRDFFLSNRAYSLEAEERAAEIQNAIDGLRKTANSWEHYEYPAQQKLDEKWGEGQFRFEPIEDKPGLSELHVEYANVKTEEDKKQYSKEFREALEIARKQYMKDKRATYKYIADNIDKWWD